MNQEYLRKTMLDYGVGLTGGIATGKSTISALLRHSGVEVIDADILAKIAVEPGSAALARISKKFGDQYILSDGSLNRQLLRTYVFANPKAISSLEEIVHPEIKQLLKLELIQRDLINNPRLWVYEAALLVEKNLTNDFGRILVSFCSPETQITRLVSRDSISELDAKEILSRQLPTSDKLLLADFKIDTDIPLARLETIVEQLMVELSGLAPFSSV